jgi:hypothetical protein
MNQRDYQGIVLCKVTFFHLLIQNRSYAGWITNMSGIDDRLLKALRAIRSGEWVYGVKYIKKIITVLILISFFFCIERYWFRSCIG